MKGKGYSPSQAVADALKLIKLQTEVFFRYAQHFQQSRPFDSREEARKFTEWFENQTGLAVYQPPPVVRSFADWILIAKTSALAEKLHFLSTRR